MASKAVILQRLSVLKDVALIFDIHFTPRCIGFRRLLCVEKFFELFCNAVFFVRQQYDIHIELEGEQIKIRLEGSLTSGCLAVYIQAM